MGGGGQGPGGCLQGIRGMGAKYFFSGPKGPPSTVEVRPELPQGDDGDTSHSEDASTVSPDEVSWTRLGEDATLRSPKSLDGPIRANRFADIRANQRKTRVCRTLNQKNPRAHKKKNRHSPPPPKKREILRTWVFPAERTHFSRCP